MAPGSERAIVTLNRTVFSDIPYGQIHRYLQITTYGSHEIGQNADIHFRTALDLGKVRLRPSHAAGQVPAGLNSPP